MARTEIGIASVRSELDLGQYLKTVRKWWWLILLSTGIAAGVSYYSVRALPPTYQTYITLMAGEDAANPNVSADQVSLSERLADAYAGMVRREPILDATVRSLRLPTSW
ncbi:MAG TPA: Wzz/FepE/Etk N-terminal domain-containing protein [Chloroflexota bacterium]|nr:Wzz/FepE/Etk N-terminal domain-containing protein [Chloroflexota bacterium]